MDAWRDAWTDACYRSPVCSAFLLTATACLKWQRHVSVHAQPDLQASDQDQLPLDGALHPCVLDQRKTCTIPWKDNEENEGHAPALSICMLLGLQGAVPCDLHFYDELANQEEPIRLSIRKDPKGGWTAKVREEVLNLGHGYSTH